VAIKKCGLLYDGAVWDKAWTLYLKPVDTAMNLSMDAVRKERLPILKKAAQKIVQARHDVKQTEIEKKAAILKAEKHGKKTKQKIEESAVKEPKAKTAIREANEKKASKKGENDIKVAKEKGVKQAARIKEINTKEEEKAAAFAAARVARDKAESSAEASKTSYDKLVAAFKKSTDDYKAAAAAHAEHTALEKLKIDVADKKKYMKIMAVKLDAKVKAAAKMAESKDKAEAAKKVMQEKKSKADRGAAENKVKMDKVASEERDAKLQKAMGEKRNKESVVKAKKKAELDSKKAQKAAKIAAEKAAKAVVEKHQKSQASAEKKEKILKKAQEAKKKKDKKDEAAEKKMKKDLSDQEKENKEAAQKQAERVAAGKHGREALIKIDVKHLSMKAQKASQKGIELKQKLVATGSTDPAQVSRESAQKEKGEKLEAQAMSAQTNAGNEHRRKIADKAANAHREGEEKMLEMGRKVTYRKKQSAKKHKRYAELKTKNGAAHEEGSKKFNVEKLKMEKQAKAASKKHVQKIAWLKTKGKEHDSKGEWKLAQATEASLKKTTKEESAAKAEAVKDAAAAKAQAVKDAAASKAAADKAGEEARLRAIAFAAEQARLAQVAADKALAEEKQAKTVLAEKNKKTDVKNKEISDKKEKAEKLTNKEKASKKEAELAKKSAEVASKKKIAVEKAAAEKAAADQAVADAKRKKAEMESLAAEKVVKAAHAKATEKHRKTESKAKEVTSKEEKADKIHEAEQDVKERRTKKAPFNMTYAKNWETSISPGYSGAYSYVWKDYCVLGGVLSSVGTIPKERLYKKRVMFGALQTKGIRAQFWGKLPAVTSMAAAMAAAKLNKGNMTTKVWYDKLALPLSTTNPPKPWRWLNKDYTSNFAANFSGFLRVSRGGLYKFWLTSTGGSELWLANREVIVNDQKNQVHGMLTKKGVVTLEPGPIPFNVMYFTRDPHAGLQLEWEGPDFKRTIVTSEAVGSKESRSVSNRFRGLQKPGWQGSFWANIGMTNNLAQAFQKAITPEDTTDFNPNYRSFLVDEINYSDEKGSFWPGLSNRFEYRYAAKFASKLMITETGAYTFFLTSIDGSQLKLNDKLLVDNDGLHAKKTVEAKIQLEPGSPDIEVSYFDNHHGSLLKVEYSGPQTGYKRVLISGGGKVPAVGQFKQVPLGRKLLSENAGRTLLTTEVVELGASSEVDPVKKNLAPKNRRRAKWLKDFTWGQEVSKGNCECEKEKDATILTSMQFHRRRRNSSRRRFQGKDDPKDEMDEVDENDVFLQMGLGQEKEKEAAKPAAKPKKKFQGEQPPAGLNCKCPKSARQAGWKADFWKNMPNLSGLTKAVQNVFTKKADKTATLWSLAFQPIGGPWKLKKGDKADKDYAKDYVAAFEGYVKVPKTGSYAFFLSSDDGAEMYVDNTRVIDNDGLHDMQENAGTIKLVKDALARIRIYYFSSQGSPGLIVQWQPPDAKKQVINGRVLWSRKAPTMGNPAEDAPVKVRRRYVARRRVELTAAQLRSCGISSPPAKKNVKQAQADESISQAVEKLTAVKQQVKAQETQLHEAEKRAQHHPIASARVKYAEIAVEMKKKIHKLKADKTAMGKDLKKLEAANPKAAKSEGVVTKKKASPAKDKSKKKEQHAICKDPKTKLACCKTSSCSQAVVDDYLKIKKKISEQQAKATSNEKKAAKSTNPDTVKAFMAKVATAQKTIVDQGKKLGKALVKLNKVEVKPAAKPDANAPAEESEDGDEAAAADGGDNTLGEAKEETQVMTKVEAKTIRQQANEMAVKEKCADQLYKQARNKSLATSAKAKEMVDKKDAQAKQNSDLKAQCTKTLRNHNMILQNPSSSRDQKDESSIRVAKCKKKESKAHEQLKKIRMRAGLTVRKAKSIKRDAKKAAQKKEAIEARELKAKLAAKKAEKFVKLDARKQEAKTKSTESATKKTNYELVAQLPEGCRPKQAAQFLAQSKDGTRVRVDVKPDGSVRTVMASLRYVSLDGIMFARDPNPATAAMEVKLKNQTDLAESNDEMPPQPQIAGHFDDYKIVHVFDVNKKPHQHHELGEVMAPAKKKAKKEENKESAPLAWDEKKTKAEFEKIQKSYNDPDVWSLCAREKGVCKSTSQYKMKYGNQGVFRYRVSSGNTPCGDSVFGEFKPEFKKVCYKYTPNAKRRRATGMFRDVSKTGIQSRWYANVGKMSSLGSAMKSVKGKEAAKTFFVKNMMFPETQSYWNKLDSRFTKYFVAKFTGVMMIKETGKYQFYVTADDGAALYIDKTEVDCSGASCSGVLALQNPGPKTKDCATVSEAEREECVNSKTVTGTATILKGTPKFELQYFVNDGPHWLNVEWSGKDFSKRPLSDEFIGQYEKFVEEGGNWNRAAKEGGNVVIKETSEVKFGIGDKWVYKMFKSGVVKCSSAVFGNPAPGQKKVCFKRLDKTGDHWRECAVDGQICKGFPGEHKVRYGASGSFAFLETIGDTLCSVETFGDPKATDPSMKKTCSVLEMPSKPKPTPTLSGGNAVNGRLMNLALKRPTAQMSTKNFGSVAFDGAPSRAVDGINSGKYGDNSCTHTFAGLNPWWRVKLAKDSTIASVKIFGRTDGVKNCDHSGGGNSDCALNDVNVYVSNKPYPGSGKACLSEASNLDPKGTTINCNGMTGKYVFVQKAGKASLSLCEVQVMGMPATVKAVVKPKPKPPKPREPLYQVTLKNGWEARDPITDKIRVTVQKTCENCKEILCVLQGTIRQAGGATPDPTSLIGNVPLMCKPSRKQIFLQANAVTGSAKVMIYPSGRIKATKFLNRIGWEDVSVSLDGIYYITDGGLAARKLAKAISESKASGQKMSQDHKRDPEFTSKRLGPICMVWGQVGGAPGSVVGTVSAECRPSQKQIFHAAASDATAWVSIDTSGAVTVETSGPIGPKYPSSDKIDKIMSGDGALVWINPMPAGPGGNMSAIQNKTGRYPLPGKSDAPLTKKMSMTAGKPIGQAKPETILELFAKAAAEKKKGASSIELLEVQEEDGLVKTVSLSLAGIVYAVADHHPYVRGQRKTIYHGAAKKEMHEKKMAKPPAKLSSCELPNIKDSGFKQEIKVASEKVENQGAIAKNAKDALPKAVDQVGKDHYKGVISKANIRAGELKAMLANFKSNQTALHAEFKDCFKPRAPASVLGTVTNMCKNWNGTLAESAPDCCKQKGKCTVVQMENIDKTLDASILKRKLLEKGFVKVSEAAIGRGSDTAEKKKEVANLGKRAQNKRDAKENAAKKLLVGKAIRAAKGLAPPTKMVKKAPALAEEDMARDMSAAEDNLGR